MANDKKFVVKNGLSAQNIDFVDNNFVKVITVNTNANTAVFSDSVDDILRVGGVSADGTVLEFNDTTGSPVIRIQNEDVNITPTSGRLLIGSIDNPNNVDRVQIEGGTTIDTITADSVSVNTVNVTDLLRLPSLSQDTIDSLTGSVQQGSLVQNASTGSVNLYDGVSWVALVVAGSWTPETLFAASEPGVWFDPSDLTTLFQDVAGTTPVTTPGQTVGLMLDKSGRGNHATQATTASRPTYAVVPKTGRRNLLTFTEQFDKAAWSGSVTVTPNVEVAPDGSTTADLLTTQPVVSSNIRQNVALSAGQHTVSFWVKAGTSTSVSFGMFLSGFISGTASIISGPGSASGSSLVVLSGLSTSLWTRVQFTFTATASSHGFYIYPEGTGTGTGKTAYIWGAQLETGSTATAYQKVTSQYDVTEAGVPSLSYLSFDGVDDWMVTPTITPGVDKVQVFAGVRDSALTTVQQNIIELSAGTGDGRFLLHRGLDTLNRNLFQSRGTLSSSAGSATPSSPVTLILTGFADISGDSATLRVNGEQANQSTSDQGTGNFLAYPIYIGRRAGTSLPFNGHLYGLITRFGANLDTSTIEKAERWLNLRTGAF